MTETNVRYIAILALTAGLQISAGEAQQAPMSPDVKAYLCTLAKRDAAITPEQIEAHEQAYAACLAEPDPEGIVSEDYECTTERDWASNILKPKTTIKCSKRNQEKRKECPEPTRKLQQRLASAPERVAKYCADD